MANDFHVDDLMLPDPPETIFESFLSYVPQKACAKEQFSSDNACIFSLRNRGKKVLSPIPFGGRGDGKLQTIGSGRSGDMVRPSI